MNTEESQSDNGSSAVSELHKRVQEEYWNWGSSELSANYELYLLRWETKLQVGVIWLLHLIYISFLYYGFNSWN